MEGKVFEIDGFKVIFKFEEVFNDMKKFVMLGGELLNSVKFFFLFVNVLKENCLDLKGIFVINGGIMWYFWKYEERIVVVN